MNSTPQKNRAWQGYSRRSRTRQAGFATLFQTVVFSVIMLALLFSAISLYSVGVGQFASTANASYTEMDADKTARFIQEKLGAARLVTFDSDGQGVTYYNFQYVAQADNDGTVVVDARSLPVKDTTAHRIYRSGTSLLWSDNTSKPLLKNLSLNDPPSDPQPTTASYNIFAPGGSARGFNNAVTVKLITYPTYGAAGGVRHAMQRALVNVVCRNAQTWK